MADINPKLKMYIFLCTIAVFLNLGFNIMKMAYANSLDIIGLLAGFITAFIPFASTITLTFSLSLVPIEVIALVGIITGIISAIQAWLLIEIIVSHIPFVDV